MGVGDAVLRPTVRMLGVDPAEATSISHRDLPDLPEYTAWA